MTAGMNAPFKPMMVWLFYCLFPKELHLKRREEGALLYCISVSIYPKNSHLPGPSVHGILQARILKWVSILFSRGFSQPRDWTWVPCIAGRFSTVWAIREVHLFHNIMQRRSSRKDKVKFPVWIFIVTQRIFYSTIHQKDGRKEDEKTISKICLFINVFLFPG